MPIDDWLGQSAKWPQPHSWHNLDYQESQNWEIAWREALRQIAEEREELSSDHGH